MKKTENENEENRKQDLCYTAFSVPAWFTDDSHSMKAPPKSGQLQHYCLIFGTSVQDSGEGKPPQGKELWEMHLIVYFA